MRPQLRKIEFRITGATVVRDLLGTTGALWVRKPIPAALECDQNEFQPPRHAVAAQQPKWFTVPQLRKRSRLVEEQLIDPANGPAPLAPLLDRAGSYRTSS